MSLASVYVALAAVDSTSENVGPDLGSQLCWQSEEGRLLVGLDAVSCVSNNGSISDIYTYRYFSAPLGQTLGHPFLNVLKPRAGRLLAPAGLGFWLAKPSAG